MNGFGSAGFVVLTFCVMLADLKAAAPDGMTNRITLRAMITCPTPTLRPNGQIAATGD